MNGQAYDLLFEKNAVMVTCKSFHKNKKFIEENSINVKKNNSSNVTLDLDYLASIYFFEITI